jgi:hypothetical protein
VVALCADYERRERLIREGGLPLRMISELRYLNMKILDGAEEEAFDDGMIFISDIGARVGYVNSNLDFMSEPTYKRRKAAVKRSIAKKLYLI